MADANTLSMGENDIPKRLLWVDLEMTGLNPEKQHIIEIAALVTDFQFQEVARYEAVINQPEEVLQNAEDWPREHMAELFATVRTADKGEDQVQDEFLQFIERHFPDEQAILAGNSIHQDRRFIRQWWQKVDARLHYRMLDVSSYKIWIQGAMGEQFVKQEQHRALGDIEESIIELKWCFERLASRE